MPFPLRRLFSTAGTNLYRGQPHSPRRNLRPRKCTCYIHPAPPPPCTDPSPPPSGPTGERTHNKRPDPATPSGLRLGPRSAASSDNDQHLARLLRPGSPLTTRRPGAPLARLPVSSAAVAPDKRGRCPRPGGRQVTCVCMSSKQHLVRSTLLPPSMETICGQSGSLYHPGISHGTNILDNSLLALP